MSLRRLAAPGLVVIAVFAALPLVTGAYTLSLIYTIFTFTALAYSWNIVSGYTGYVSFGHVSFFGLGGYTTALLIVTWHWPWGAAVLAGGALAGLLALRWLSRWLEAGRWQHFGYYCLGAAAVIFVLAHQGF